MLLWDTEASSLDLMRFFTTGPAKLSHNHSILTIWDTEHA